MRELVCRWCTGYILGDGLDTKQRFYPGPDGEFEDYHYSCWKANESNIWERRLPGAKPIASNFVDHPDHYKWLPVEAIEVTEHFNFCMGNALKYIIRADHKGNPIEDLKKARWYIDREIEKRLRDGDSDK